MSQIFADKERECQQDSYSALACKIAKWASLAFAAIVGTLGALSFGAGIGLASMLGFLEFPVIPVVLGIVTLVLFEVNVVKKIWQQVSMYKTDQAIPLKEQSLESTSGLGSVLTSTAAMPGGLMTLPGSIVTYGCFPGLMKISQIFADKEKECQQDSYTALACKISKWASLAFAATVGILGTLLIGIGLAFATHWIIEDLFKTPYGALAHLAPLALPLGLGSIILPLYEGVQVIKKVREQALMYTSDQAHLPPAVANLAQVS